MAAGVYLGGHFSWFSGGYQRTNFAAVDATTGQVLPLVANTDTLPVFGIAAASNQVFIAGNFLAFANQPRAGLASLDAATGTLTAWQPDADSFMFCANVYSNVLYVGGSCLHMGGMSTVGIGAFPLSFSGSPSIVTGSMRCSVGSAQFQLSAPGVSQATVLVSSNLASWQPLLTVPLYAGQGICVDTDVFRHPVRAYRVRVP